MLALRDIKVKYANTLLGITWTILQPLTGLLIFTLLFNYVLNVQSPGISYPVFAFLGYSSWMFFSNLFNQAATSMHDNQTLINKVSFPRLVFHLSKVITCGLDFLISAALLMFLLPFFKVQPSLNIFLLPLFVLLNILAGLALAIWLSALAIKKRDLFHIIPYITGFGIWLTPVFYNMDIFPSKWNFVFYLNPMATIMEGYRWCLSADYILDTKLLWNIPALLILLITGIHFFKNRDKQIADYL